MAPEVPADRPKAVVCAGGLRSSTVISALKRLGVNDWYNVTGGMAEAHLRPVEGPADPEGLAHVFTRRFEVPVDATDEAIRLNLHGTLIPSMVFGARMAEQQSGCIINIASVSSTGIENGSI